MEKTLKKVNLFLVGAPKAGTTSAVNLLRKNKDTYVSPIKEPNFFGKDFDFQEFSKTYQIQYAFDPKQCFEKKRTRSKHISFVQNSEDYAQLFAPAFQTKYRIDGSTSYLFSKKAAKEIFAYNPDSKIIISLRNPVERALSHYAMLLGIGTEKEKNAFRAFKKDFSASKKGFGVTHLYIEMGLYFDQVKRYYEVFPEAQILVIDFEDIVHAPQKVAQKMAHFLNIDLEKTNMAQKNKSVVPKHPVINHFKKYKRFVPPFFIETIKSSPLYEQNPKSKYGNRQAILFLNEKLEKNWAQTRGFLKEKGIALKPTE